VNRHRISKRTGHSGSRSSYSGGSSSGSGGIESELEEFSAPSGQPEHPASVGTAADTALSPSWHLAAATMALKEFEALGRVGLGLGDLFFSLTLSLAWSDL
jgi:hypothetical protein